MLMKDNLKRYLCNKLIKENLVKEGDFIRHSYTKNRLNKMYTQNSVCPDTCPTLDTRCDCLGVVVNDMSYVSEKYKKFIDKNGYIPDMFCPYNECEIKDCAKTVTTQCGSTTSSATCLINESDTYSEYSKEKIKNNIVIDDYVNTITANAMQSFNHNNCHLIEENKMNNLRIRKLTPKECFRLMGVKDEDSDKLNHLSNATKQGYLEATEGDGVNIGSRMQYQRGNVQKAMIQTITTSGGVDRGVSNNTTSEDKWSDLD